MVILCKSMAKILQAIIGLYFPYTTYYVINTKKGGDKMRKNISVTNAEVLDIFSKASNVSKLIEDAVLDYTKKTRNAVDTLTKSEIETIISHAVKDALKDLKEEQVKTADGIETLINSMLDLVACLQRQI